MTFLARFLPIAAMVLLAAALAGCSPSGQSQADEEKESHFQTGKSCLNSMDFIGAIESFEKALEVNPRSASAHFELACLFDQKQSDPAAAIYHYEKYLKLRPDAGNADRARERIYVCKQDLAKSVLPLPVAPAMQRQFEQLAEQNRQLQEELGRWKAYYNQTQAPTGSPVQPPGRVAQSSNTGSSSLTNSTSYNGGGTRTGSAVRTHVVQQGETFSSIARKYSVKLDAVLAANPNIPPKNLRPGQTINLPP